MVAKVEFEIYLRTRKHYVRGSDGFIERKKTLLLLGFWKQVA